MSFLNSILFKYVPEADIEMAEKPDEHVVISEARAIIPPRTPFLQFPPPQPKFGSASGPLAGRSGLEDDDNVMTPASDLHDTTAPGPWIVSSGLIEDSTMTPAPGLAPALDISSRSGLQVDSVMAPASDLHNTAFGPMVAGSGLIEDSTMTPSPDLVPAPSHPMAARTGLAGNVTTSPPAGERFSFDRVELSSTIDSHNLPTTPHRRRRSPSPPSATMPRTTVRKYGAGVPSPHRQSRTPASPGTDARVVTRKDGVCQSHGYG